MILNDNEISTLCWQNDLIQPNYPEQVRANSDGKNIISYGLSSFGYDIRVANEFQIHYRALSPGIIDPKNYNDYSSTIKTNHPVDIPPNSFALARSVERIKMPRNLIALCVGKSTYARCGIIVNVTPLEPEWEGYITLEISNTTPHSARIYPNEGIAQLIFLKGKSCYISYKDRKGKYQNQEQEIVPPRI